MTHWWELLGTGGPLAILLTFLASNMNNKRAERAAAKQEAEDKATSALTAQEAADKQDEDHLAAMLESQRRDFQAIVEPLQDSVKFLRTENREMLQRVSTLELRVSSAEADTRFLIHDFGRVLDHMEQTYNDLGPRLSRRVIQLLGRAGVRRPDEMGD